MYLDTLNRIKNAQAADKNKITAPFSKVDAAILDILTKYGFINGFDKKGKIKKYLEIRILDKSSDSRIRDIKITSKPSRHIYFPYKKLRPFKNNYGVGVISTSKGIMTTAEARKHKVGGELLFEIW